MKKLILIYSVLLLTACGTSFKAVMTECDNPSNQEFSKFKNCIQSTYLQNGGDVNSDEYKGFAAKLNEINEDYTSQKITSTQAKSNTYQEFENWNNKVNPPKGGGSATVPYTKPTYTKPINCHNYGTYTSCN